MLQEYKKEHTRVTVIETSKSDNSTHDKAMMAESAHEATKSGPNDSNNSVNRAFVYYNDEEEDVKKESQESPIFFGNANCLNDTSSFLNE